VSRTPFDGPGRVYPIVPDTAWLERLLPTGIAVVQLRIKDRPRAEIRREISRAVALTRSTPCQLIVNDDWDLALEAQATFVHLGQGDLAGADIAALKRAGVGLGISTHSHEELDTALRHDPDYIALGPIYETQLKAMPWAPQGLARIAEWKRLIGRRALVAIGGITLDRAPGVWAAGADSAAVVTDVIAAPNPPARLRAWLTAASVDKV
jgi:thiamine-phosphate pyrophosphorylase